jgi:hypothetical protein
MLFPNVTQRHYTSTNEVTTFLSAQLPKRWIGREESTSLPPRSPDLNPSNFFLLGFVKAEVHFSANANIHYSLKDRIQTTAKTDRLLL